MDVSTVQRWEAGRSTPQMWVRTSLAASLGLTSDELAALVAVGSIDAAPPLEAGASVSPEIATGDPFRDGAVLPSGAQLISHEWPIVDDNIDLLFSDASGFSTLTHLLASQRQKVAPDVLLSLVEAHGSTLSRLFGKSISDPLRSEIGVLLGETSIIASRLWSAIGNRRLALACCAYARRLARSLGNSALEATVKIFESNLHSEAATLLGEGGDVPLGLQLLHEAASVGRELGPAARARIAAEQAQCYAALGSRRECEIALRTARVESTSIAPGAQLGLFSDWDPTRVDVYEGTCELLLGADTRAVALLSRSIAASKTSTSARLNVDLAASVDLAGAYARAGDLDQGCGLLMSVYARLSELGNQRGVSRARQAIQWFEPWKNEPHVVEMREFIRAQDIRFGSPSASTSVS